jgi:hypothetical protein
LRRERELVEREDRERIARITQAFLKMKNLNIAAVKWAAA